MESAHIRAKKKKFSPPSYLLTEFGQIPVKGLWLDFEATSKICQKLNFDPKLATQRQNMYMYTYQKNHKNKKFCHSHF